MLHILFKKFKQCFKNVKTSLSKEAIQNEIADLNHLGHGLPILMMVLRGPIQSCSTQKEQTCGKPLDQGTSLHLCYRDPLCFSRALNLKKIKQHDLLLHDPESSELWIFC